MELETRLIQQLSDPEDTDYENKEATHLPPVGDAMGWSASTGAGGLNGGSMGTFGSGENGGPTSGSAYSFGTGTGIGTGIGLGIGTNTSSFGLGSVRGYDSPISPLSAHPYSQASQFHGSQYDVDRATTGATTPLPRINIPSGSKSSPASPTTPNTIASSLLSTSTGTTLSTLSTLSSSSTTTHNGEELVVPTTFNWRKRFALGKIQGKKNEMGGEMQGWWEDPDDPVHVLNRCAPVIIEMWRDGKVKQRLGEKRLRLEESSGL